MLKVKTTPVWAEKGEILKFIGDAMLVVFRIGDETSPSDAAMGEAVNLVSRIQHRMGETGEDLLFTGEVAEHLTKRSEAVGGAFSI